MGEGLRINVAGSQESCKGIHELGAHNRWESKVLWEEQLTKH